MNLLEHYIKDILSVENVPHEEWMKKKYVNVTMIVNCYGIIEVKNSWFSEKEWEVIKEQGYFLS